MDWSIDKAAILYLKQSEALWLTWSCRTIRLSEARRTIGTPGAQGHPRDYWLETQIKACSGSGGKSTLTCTYMCTHSFALSHTYTHTVNIHMDTQTFLFPACVSWGQRMHSYSANDRQRQKPFGAILFFQPMAESCGHYDLVMNSGFISCSSFLLRTHIELHLKKDEVRSVRRVAGHHAQPWSWLPIPGAL